MTASASAVNDAWPFPFPFAPWSSWAPSALSSGRAVPCCPFPVPENAGPVSCLTTPLNRSRTSAAAVGLRASLPLKITSSIQSPRRLLALCSPITHVIASATLLLPQPLGPTIAVTPLSNASSERSENDLKPLISKRSRRMAYTRAPAPMPIVECLAGRQTGANGRQCTKAYLLGQDQSLAPFVVVS